MRLVFFPAMFVLFEENLILVQDGVRLPKVKLILVQAEMKGESTSQVLSDLKVTKSKVKANQQKKKNGEKKEEREPI
jgi:hypothetical protein